MRTIKFLFIFLCFSALTHAQKHASLNGYIVDGETGEKVPFATLIAKNHNQQIRSNEFGYYQFEKLPDDNIELIVESLGYEKTDKKIKLDKNKTTNENILLFPTEWELDELVVTANRHATKRKEAPVLVNLINQKTFETTSSCTLAEGLTFQPGVRVENNCQNCGFQQVRMNGLEGPYTQILIDSRSLFSSLAGVYGIEQIPANMIDRVEIVRGGGSALFGSNAIGGTINIITKEPTENSFSVGETFSLINGKTPMNVVNLNSSLVAHDGKAGIYLYGMFKDRKQWDKDGDGFSELGKLNSNSFGFRSFYKINPLNKLILEYHRTKEDRRGGDQLKRPPHETQITEMANHDINGGSLSYIMNSSDYKQNLEIYSSLQSTKRDTYYGTDYNENAYGNTDGITVVSGTKYAYSFDKLGFMPAQLTAGFEHHYDYLHDEMLGYHRDLKQIAYIYGGYLQNEWKNDKITFLLGARIDKHNFVDNAIVSPRVNFRYSPIKNISLRASYATGYRAPQTFDEDLHVTAVNGEVSFIQNTANLKPEYSHSFNLSADYTFNIENWKFNVIADGFYTYLKDVFVLEEIGKDELGNLLKERRNGSGAVVKGVNLELGIIPTQWLDFQSGFTIQSSKYKEPEQWSEDDESVAPTRQMLRTPDYYGFFTANVKVTPRFMASISTIYTGQMYVPHFAGYIKKNELKHTRDFTDASIRLSYNFKIGNKLTFQLNGGVKNILNSYQSDFDRGMDRDAGYVYGPGTPRTFFMGFKLGQF